MAVVFTKPRTKSPPDSKRMCGCPIATQEKSDYCTQALNLQMFMQNYEKRHYTQIGGCSLYVTNDHTLLWKTKNALFGCWRHTTI